MNLRALAVALALLFVLCCSAGAKAATVPTDDAARVGLFLPLARTAWPASACAGRENIVLGAQATALIDAADAADGKRTIGRAWPRACTMALRPGNAAYGFCVTLVHEAGHLAGVPHTSAYGDVMNGDGQSEYLPCHAAADPTDRQEAVAHIQTMLPAPVASWRVTCTPFKLRHPTCRASRPGAKVVRRYEVRMTNGALTGVNDLNPTLTLTRRSR